MFPQRPQLVLTPNVPDGKLDVLVFQSLDVKPDGRDGLNKLVLLQLEEDRGLAGSVQSQSYDSHLDFWSDVNSVILKENIFYSRKITVQLVASFYFILYAPFKSKVL
jgi:hypothetical protein